MDKQTAQEYLMQGTVLAGQGKFAEAIVYYDKAEKEDPLDMEIYLSRGIAFANLEKLEEAKLQFEKALKINRTSGLAYFHLGCIALLEGDSSAGFENFNKAISNGYEDAQLYFSIGLLHEERGETDLAIRNYTKAIHRDPLRPDIRIRKAHLLIRGEHLPEALQTLDETILMNPDIFEGYHLKFLLLLELGRFEEAGDLLNTAMDLFPQDIGFIMDKVKLSTAQGDTEEALRQLNELEAMPDIEEELLRRVYLEKAQISADAEQVEEAIVLLEKAKKISEKNSFFDSDVVFLLANCYLATKNYENVLHCARELLKKDSATSNRETARYLEALALKMMGKTEEAEALYREAIREFRRQSLETPGNLDAYMLRAMCLKDINEGEKALELVDYVITLQPDRPEPKILRATILEEMGMAEEADSEYSLAGDLLPEKLRKKEV